MGGGRGDGDTINYLAKIIHADEVQAWKHPHDQSAGLYGARKRNV